MMNFEEDAKINISNNNLDEVSQLCQELSNLENDIQSYEETVKELKKKAEKLSMEVIPEKDERTWFKICRTQ
jgi:prefoldin subunit 5